MAHWAKINEENIVETIIVTSNDEADEGESWIAENLEGRWVKTSYNTRRGIHLFGGTPFRKNFAEVGGTYSPELDAFIPAKLEWQKDFILDEETCDWVPAVPFPEDADYVMFYGKTPATVEVETEINGETVLVGELDVLPTDNVYFWLHSESDWGMYPNSNYPKPEGQYFWNPLAKEWQAPTDEKPEGQYFWNVFTNEWVEVPAPPEAPTE